MPRRREKFDEVVAVEPAACFESGSDALDVVPTGKE